MEDFIPKLLLSLLLGGLIGAEREYRSKSAGFRTIMLICMGATIFTILSRLISPGTPDRIASNIVTGIGFVGAGIIFKGETGVNGITTAATIWVSAALGMGIGAGYWQLSSIACGLVLIVLFAFTYFQSWIDRIHQFRNYQIVCEYENTTLHRFETLFKLHHLRYRRIRQTKVGSVITGVWIVQGSERNHRQFIQEMMQDASIQSFQF